MVLGDSGTTWQAWLNHLLLVLSASCVAYAAPSKQPKPPAFEVDHWRREPPPLWRGLEQPWNIEPYVFDKDTPMVNVTLVAEQTGRATGYNLGINTPVYVPKKFYDEFGVDIIKEGGFKFLRWPGGSVADKYIWNFDYATFPWFEGRGYEPPHYYNTDDFIDLCKATGAEPIVQANFAVFMKYGFAAGTDLAVTWLQHFKARGVAARYWTLGNENYGYWETPNAERFGKKVDGNLYGLALKSLSAGLKAVDPDLYVGAVVTASQDMGDLRADEWMKTLGPHLAGTADFAELHAYFMDISGDYKVPSTDEIYEHDRDEWIGSLRWNVDNLTQTYGNVTLPVALTEWNVDLVHPRSDDTPDQQISALLVPDLVSRMMMGYGFGANNYFAFSDALHSEYFRPWRVPGDLGIVARDDPTTIDGTPRPAWYAYALMSRIVGNVMYNASVTKGPPDYWFESMSAGRWLDVVPNVEARVWTFSTGEISVLLSSRHHPDDAKEQIAVCLQGIEQLNVTRGSPVRGWVLSPGNPYFHDPVRDKGTRWNGHRGSTAVGGPFPLNYTPALSANTTHVPQGCAAVVALPPGSVAGVIFYTHDSKWVDPPTQTSLQNGSPALDTFFDFAKSVGGGWSLYGCMTILLASILVLCFSRMPRMLLFSSDPRSSRIFLGDVPFNALFELRIVGTVAFLLVMYFDITYLIWLPLHGWSDGVTWYAVLYLLAEICATISGTAYFVCSCFRPRPLKTDGEWTSEDTDARLMEQARLEPAVIVQCHYNEPVEEIAESLRCNLRYFKDLGFSRECRRYYICDDGFYTGEGEERTLRQIGFCNALREAVYDVLGTKSEANLSHDVPLALKEGKQVKDVWRTDCALGFLIWNVGSKEDHVYLVAREKPQPHHAKAGNINNFLYNVLPFHLDGSSNSNPDVEQGLPKRSEADSSRGTHVVPAIPSFVSAVTTAEGVSDATSDSGVTTFDQDMLFGFSPSSVPTYMLVLDQDMCLGHAFLTALPDYRHVEAIAMAKPVFESDWKRTCFVQFPQHFKDMHKMDVTFNSNATFYKAVQIGRGAVGLAAFAGTNCVWDISKLFSIGGVQYGSVTEDSNTSIIAHKHGLRSRYIDAPIAAGNSPQTVEDAIKQVCSRWAKGAIDMLLQRCSVKNHPENLCTDAYRVPPAGLADAYGLHTQAHFKQEPERGMRRTFLEGLLVRVFSLESMCFPFWSLVALIHAVLASWLLVSMKSPISLEVMSGFFVVMAHMVLKLVYPIIAFPQVRVVEIWYSMGTWMGLAPTMLTHAVLTALKEKCCPCGRRAQWSSIGQRKTRFYKSQLGIVAVAAILLSLSVYRCSICLSAPDVPSETCPVVGVTKMSGKMLPNRLEVEGYDCTFAAGAWGDAGGLCGLLEDDMSPIYCHCCCHHSGQCGYMGRPDQGSLRPAGTEGPCPKWKSAGALLYAFILLILAAPWVYAVFRDLRRYGYVQGVHAQERVQSVALLHRLDTYQSRP